MQDFWNRELTVLQWMMLVTVTVLVLTCLRWRLRRLRIGHRKKRVGRIPLEGYRRILHSRAQQWWRSSRA